MSEQSDVPQDPNADPREAGFGPGERGDSIEEGRQGERASRVAASRRTTTPEKADQRASVSETPNALVEYFSVIDSSGRRESRS